MGDAAVVLKYSDGCFQEVHNLQWLIWSKTTLLKFMRYASKYIVCTLYYMKVYKNIKRICLFISQQSECCLKTVYLVTWLPPSIVVLWLTVCGTGTVVQRVDLPSHSFRITASRASWAGSSVWLEFYMFAHVFVSFPRTKTTKNKAVHRLAPLNCPYIWMTGNVYLHCALG